MKYECYFLKKKISNNYNYGLIVFVVESFLIFEFVKNYIWTNDIMRVIYIYIYKSKDNLHLIS